MQELTELFRLDEAELRSSTTQAQLAQRSVGQHATSASLAPHSAMLERLPGVTGGLHASGVAAQRAAASMATLCWTAWFSSIRMQHSAGVQVSLITSFCSPTAWTVQMLKHMYQVRYTRCYLHASLHISWCTLAAQA